MKMKIVLTDSIYATFRLYLFDLRETNSHGTSTPCKWRDRCIWYHLILLQLVSYKFSGYRSEIS